MRPAAWTLLIALAVPLAAGIAPASSARARQATEADEDQQRRELESVRRQAAEKRKRAQELKVREGRAIKDLRTTERKLSTTRKNVKQLTARELELERQLEATRLDLERSRARLATSAPAWPSACATSTSTDGPASSSSSSPSQSFAQLLARMDFLTRVARQDRRILLGINEQKERIEWNESRLDETHQEVDARSTRRPRSRSASTGWRSRSSSR